MPDRQQIRDAVIRHFEAARERPGSAYEPDRFLAHLTKLPQAKGRRVADTFAGRRRFVRFMHAVQLDLGVCFTFEEWERGYTLDDFVTLVETKAGKSGAAARLARERLKSARTHLVETPVKVGLLASPLLLGAVLTSRTGLRVILGALWLAISAGVAVLAWREHTYCRTLAERVDPERS